MKNFYTQFKLWMMALVAMFAVSTSAFAGTDPDVSFDFSADHSNYSAADGGMVWSKGGVKLVTCSTYDGYVVISANAKVVDINNEWIKLFSTSNIEKVVFHGAKDLVVDGHALVEGDTWTGSATELYVYSDSYDVQVTGVDVYFGEGLENNYAPEEEEGDIPTEPQEVATSLQWGTAVVMALPKAMKGNWYWNSEMEGVSVVDPNGNPCTIAVGWANNGQEVVYLELASEPTVGGEYTASIAANVIPGLKYAIFGHFKVEGKEVGPEPEPEPEPDPVEQALLAFGGFDQMPTSLDGLSDFTKGEVSLAGLTGIGAMFTAPEALSKVVFEVAELTAVEGDEATSWVVDPSTLVSVDGSLQSLAGFTGYLAVLGERYVFVEGKKYQTKVAAYAEGVEEPVVALTCDIFGLTPAVDPEPEPEVMEIVSVALVNGEDVYELTKAAPSVEASVLLNVKLSQSPAEGESVTYSLQAYEPVMGEFGSDWAPVDEPVSGEFHALAVMGSVTWQANLEQTYYQGYKYTLTISVGELSEDYDIYGATEVEEPSHFLSVVLANDEDYVELTKGDASVASSTALFVQLCNELADVETVTYSLQTLEQVQGEDFSAWAPVGEPVVGELVPSPVAMVANAWVAELAQEYAQGTKYALTLTAGEATETFEFNGATVSEDPVGPDPYVPEEGEEIVTFDFANALYNGVPYSEACESNEYYTWYTWKKGDVMTVEGHPGYTITSEFTTEISQSAGFDYAGLSCKMYNDGKMTVAVPAGMMFKKMEIHDENAKWGYASPDYNEFTAIEKGIIVREFEAGVNSVLLTPQSYNGFVTSVVIYAIPNTTGIDTVLATTATEIYNLAGVRVRSAQGVNIVNGKKVIR